MKKQSSAKNISKSALPSTIPKRKRSTRQSGAHSTVLQEHYPSPQTTTPDHSPPNPEKTTTQERSPLCTPPTTAQRRSSPSPNILPFPSNPPSLPYSFNHTSTEVPVVPYLYHQQSDMCFQLPFHSTSIISPAFVSP
uniref:Uncharacterized protein n=1 Tax=Cicer arietinum TaxID=3827 RepID=A0A1S2Y6B6_CICAR|nr:putative uncharacterized protein DDB_G0290521 [Cicer arietinum]